MCRAGVGVDGCADATAGPPLAVTTSGVVPDPHVETLVLMVSVAVTAVVLVMEALGMVKQV